MDTAKDIVTGFLFVSIGVLVLSGAAFFGALAYGFIASTNAQQETSLKCER